MSTWKRWLICLPLLAILGWPVAVQAQPLGQGTLSPSWEHPLPLMRERDTGFFVALEAIYMRVDSALGNQVLAQRGLYDNSGTIIPNTNTNPTTIPGIPGTPIGSLTPALTTGDVAKDEWDASFRLTLGYRLRDGITIQGSFWELSQINRSASASVLPGTLATGLVGQEFSESFLSAPFYNFPTEFAGPAEDVLDFNGAPVTAFGIFNGAEVFQAWHDQVVRSVEFGVRLPMLSSECARTYLTVEARHFYIEETFELRIADLDLSGQGSDVNTARYTNRWTNRLYGAQVGYGGELYMGNGFAISAEGKLGLFFDAFEGQIRLGREDGGFNVSVGPTVNNKENDVAFVPMVQTGIFCWWYPTDGIQLRVGYEFTGLFNVLRAESPIDYNIGRNDTSYRGNFMRIDGFSGGIALIF